MFHPVVSKNADINIVPSVMIDIHNTYSGTPDNRLNSGFCGDIFKFIFPFIDIEPAAYLVTGKKDVLFPVIIKIAYSNTASHITKLIDKRTGRIDFVNIITKMNTGFRCTQLCK